MLTLAVIRPLWTMIRRVLETNSMARVANKLHAVQALFLGCPKNESIVEADYAAGKCKAGELRNCDVGYLG